MDSSSFKSNPIIARGEEDKYFSLAANKSLHIQQCNDCKSYIFYPRGACPNCLSLNLNWIESSGTGEVFTFTIHYRYPEYLSDSDPYAIGMIDLDEGVRVLSRILGDPNKIFIGMRVQVAYVDTGEGGTIPAFIPEAESP